VVSALQAAGIQRGDKLALVCDWLFPSREGAYIARLARAQLIGEIRPEQFWSANDETKAKLIAVYRSAGAKALLTYRLPRAEAGWERLANSDYYVYVIH